MAELKALIFDQDGVIADTERDGQRLAFNKAFKESGFAFTWDVETYGRLLKVGGGKERMRAYFDQNGLSEKTEDMDSLIRDLHKRKTEFFMEMVEKKEVTVRPGVARLVAEAHAAHVMLAVCSTANEDAVHTLVKTLLGEEVYGWFDLILAGDVVKAKKPDPGIYNLARERLGVEPEQCMVVEDSRNGLIAAKGAGMNCLVTVTGYTHNEDFAEAQLVVSCLGDPEAGSARVLGGTSSADMCLLQDM